MSLLDKVVDHIAEKAEQGNSSSYLEAYFHINRRCCPPLSKEWESWGLAWNICDTPSKLGNSCGVALRPSQEKIEELNQIIYQKGHQPPRLSQEEIKAITSNYPFNLSQETSCLYQRANGIFPIGLGEKDWNSFDNYFVFDLPEYSESLLPLHEAMEMYNLFFASSSYCHMFPILSFENGDFLACEGCDELRNVSPIYLVVDGGQPNIVCSSLGDLLSVSLKKHKRF